MALANSKSCLVLGALFLFANLAYGTSAPHLDFVDVKNEDFVIDFRPSICTPSFEPAHYSEMIAGTPGHLQAWLDPNAILLANRGGYFSYTAYILTTEFASRHWTRCEFQVIPHGRVIDHYEKVSYSISGGSGTPFTGDVRIPILSFGAGSLIEVVPSNNPATIDLTSGKGIDLTIKNRLPDMQVHISSHADIGFLHPEYWKLSSGPFPLSNKDEIVIRNGGSEHVHLDLPPRKISALLSTWKRIKADEGNDTVSLKIIYNSQFSSDISHEITVPIPIRFVPSFANLGLVLFFGAVIGTLILQIFSADHVISYATLKSLGMNIILAICAEALAMALVFLGSKFVVLGFELDPWQPAPVFLIGLFISMGGSKVFKSVLEKILPKPGIPLQHKLHDEQADTAGARS